MKISENTVHLNALVKQRIMVRRMLMAALEQSPYSMHDLRKREDDDLYSYRSYSRDQAKHHLISMMRSIHSLNEDISDLRKKASGVSQVLEQRAKEIEKMSKRVVDELHPHFYLNCEVGKELSISRDTNTNRWNRPITVTVKLSWASKVLNKGIAPIVKHGGKSVMILDAEEVPHAELEDGVKLYKVQVAKVTKKQGQCSYHDDPNMEILEMYYTHVVGTDGKIIEPAVSPKIHSAISTANRRAAKNLMKQLLGND